MNYVENLLKVKHPILFLGKKGSGRKEHFLSCVKYLNCIQKGFELSNPCVCNMCNSIQASPDFLSFYGDERSEDISKLLTSFFQSPPIQLNEKYLWLGNFDYWSKKVQAYLFLLLEDKPEYIRIFGESSNLEYLPEAIVSRFWVLDVEGYLNSFFIEKYRNTLQFQNLKGVLESSYPIQSSFFISSYLKYSFESVFKEIFQSGSVKSSFNSIGVFLQQLENLAWFDANEVLYFFGDYSLFKLREEFGEQNKELFHRLLSSFASSFFQWVRHPESRQNVSVKNQFKSFCMSFFTLRKLLKR